MSNVGSITWLSCHVYVCFTASVVAAPPHILFVDDDATAGGDGTTWGSAFKYLQDALYGANPGTEIRVAEGTYVPDRAEYISLPAGSREVTFALASRVSVIGGYRGCPLGICGPGDPDDRNLEQYVSILSGDLAGDDQPPFLNNSENSCHVISAVQTDSSAALNGVTVTGGNGYGGCFNNRGAGMLVIESAPTIANCVFVRNSAQRGGAICNLGSNPILRNCTFEENRGYYGGALNNSENSSPYLVGCTFRTNSSFATQFLLGGGGAVYNSDSTPTILSCIFADNWADQWGGAIYSTGGAPTIVAAEFRNNRTIWDGGALYNAAGTHVELQGCQLAGNAAYYGGAVSNADGAAALMVECRFVDHYAHGRGGALYNSTGSSTQIDGCAFVRNRARLQGGALYSAPASRLGIMNSAFLQNSCQEHGGSWYNHSSEVVASNCVFSGNMAAYSGGAVYTSGSPILTNCSFSNNVADWMGGAIYHSGVNGALLTNCIVWANRDSSGTLESGQIAIVSGFPAVNHTLIQGGWSGSGGVGNLDVDPLFVDADGLDNLAGTEDDNLRLRLGSPAVNAGDNTALSMDVVRDMDGHSRILCGDVDMGAFEFGIGNYDCIGDVNIADFAIWSSCFTGPNGGVYSNGCEQFDFEFDGDVDLQDFGGLHLVFDGSK